MLKIKAWNIIKLNKFQFGEIKIDIVYGDLSKEKYLNIFLKFENTEQCYNNIWITLKAQYNVIRIR